MHESRVSLTIRNVVLIQYSTPMCIDTKRFTSNSMQVQVFLIFCVKYLMSRSDSLSTGTDIQLFLDASSPCTPMCHACIQADQESLC